MKMYIHDWILYAAAGFTLMLQLKMCNTWITFHFAWMQVLIMCPF